MNTLIDYEKLTNDSLHIGIAETIVKESPLLAMLPFAEIGGNSHTYNMEDAEAAISFYDVGGTWDESSPDWAERTCKLAIVGGDVDVDKFKAQTTKEQNIEAAIISLKSKALAHEIEKQFIFGRTTTGSSTKQYKGLVQLITEFESSSTTDLDAVNNDQVLVANATSGELTLPLMDELIDKVRPKPDILMMSRRMRRKLNTLARASGTTLRVEQNQWGKFISIFDEIPVLINDHILDNVPDNSSSVLTHTTYNQATTRAGTLDNSLIFALRFDSQVGVCALHNGGLQVEKVSDALETKDASRRRLKAYMGLACYGKLAAAVMTGVLDTAL